MNAGKVEKKRKLSKSMLSNVAVRLPLNNYIYIYICVFFSSGVADHALRLGPYMRISYYRENFNMDTGGRMRIGKS